MNTSHRREKREKDEETGKEKSKLNIFFNMSKPGSKKVIKKLIT